MRSEGAPPLSVPPISAAMRPTPGEADGQLDAKRSDPPGPALDARKAQDRRDAPELLTTEVQVELDKEAARYVQRFLDPATHEVREQFPAEAQLAFSRAVGAYLKARELSEL